MKGALREQIADGADDAVARLLGLPGTAGEDADTTPLFKGLADDRCQSPHWGYVIAGRVTFGYADGDETYAAGDAYYAPPGHVPVIEAGTELVEFSPTDEYAKTMAVVAENLAALTSS